MRVTPSRALRTLAVAAVAAAVAGGVAVAGLFGELESKTVDERFALRGTQPPPRDVVVVAIDPASFRRLKLQWPFPRALHARAIERLLAAGARTVAYDVQFSEPSASARGDRALLRAAADPRVVLGTAEARPDGEGAVLGGQPRLERSGGRLGWALFPVDSDGVMRRLQPRYDARLTQFAVLAAGGDPDAPERPIDFPGPDGTVPSISFADVVNGTFDPRRVAGRIAVVGATAPSLQDVHATAAGGLMSGPEVNADAIETVLHDYPLRDAPGVVGVLLVLAAALVAPLATLPGRRDRALAWGLAAGALGAVALLGGAQLAFDSGTIVPVTVPLLALVLGTAGAVALTYATELRHQRRTRTAFERFVPKQVVEELLRRDGGVLRLDSRRVEATVLFCDLRGFTTLAERLDAEQVIAVLNRYLELVSAAVFDHGGTVVSYQGDGVLAVFGAPLERPDHAVQALVAARTILDTALPAFNAYLREERIASEPLAVGLGINTGFVMSGSVGSERRLEYAAVGDATNVAARLQALGRDGARRLFVSDATHAALGEAAAAAGLEPFGEVELRGRSEPVTVWAA